MQMTMCWFGPEENKVPLEYIRQVPGVEGIVGALHDVTVGRVWPVDKIERLVSQAHVAGLKMEVMESVNIHDDIKIGLPSRNRYTANYQQTIHHFARLGAKVICHNFMSVLDWMKTNMNYVLPDGSLTMASEKKDIDKRLEDVAKEALENSNSFASPDQGSERLVEVQTLFVKYSVVDDHKSWENLVYLLRAVIPVCEEVGVEMAIHPDDPPYPIFGLPWVVKNHDDLDWICRAVDPPTNGITLRTGSTVEDPNNDVYVTLAEFTRRKRVHFAHARNTKLMRDRDFYECAHPSKCGSLDIYKVMQALYDNGFDGYIYPDHSCFIWGETGRPGYGLHDHALGVTYPKGLWEASSKRQSFS